MNREAHSTRREEESFLIPLKYIDVTSVTHTTFDVLQESRIDDKWDIDGARDLSDSWTGFTQCTSLKEKPPDGYMWSGWRLTKRQATSRPDHLWLEIWRSMLRNSKNEREAKLAQVKDQSLENARRLRGIYFIEPGDEEFKDKIKNARKSWKFQQRLPCLVKEQKAASMG